MKTKYSSLFAFLVLLFFSGCQDLKEDPKASLTPNTYFKSQSDLDAAVASIYIQLAIDGAWGFTSRMTSYFGSDDLTTDPGLNKADMREFDQLGGSSQNASMYAEWQGPWTAIYQANNVIANYDKVTGSTVIAKRQAAGQAYFLRALSYYYLVRTFGKVPLVLTPIDVNDRPDREEIGKVYTAIITDLDSAKIMLPNSFSGQPGKATLPAARSLLADVYLTMAGWPLKQESNYALAAAEADAVIQSGQFSLLPDYSTVFTTNNGPETVFAIQFNIGGLLPQRSYGSSSVPIEEEDLTGGTGWDDYYSELNFFKNAPKCKRTDETFYTTIKLRISGTNKYKMVPWSSTETNARHPYYKKFRAGLIGANGPDGVSETDTTILKMNPSTNKALDIIRYPYVLLDYAEAATMATGAPTAKAYAAINMVRNRAGLPNLTPGLSQLAFRDSVVYERAYEFAGEFGMRWFDIVRLQLLPQVIAARNNETYIDTDGKTKNKENPISAAARADPSTKYLAPIPQTEMNQNPWQQNPGY